MCAFILRFYSGYGESLIDYNQPDPRCVGVNAKRPVLMNGWQIWNPASEITLSETKKALQFLAQALKIAPVLFQAIGVNVAQAEVLNLESGAKQVLQETLPNNSFAPA